MLYRPRPVLEPTPAIRPTSGMWIKPAAKYKRLTASDRGRFLNREKPIAAPDCWNDPSCDKLWRYNLHYFDDLNAPDAEDRDEWHRKLIHRWINENPPGIGTGWEPYPTALRMVNWIKWTLAGNPLAPKWRRSLAVQARWLSKTVEWHLPGHHLFSEAKALVYAGLFFAGGEADAWLKQGLAILARTMADQILPDGGQFERSPMVHALALEDMLDLINATVAYTQSIPTEHHASVASWPELAAKMRPCLAGLCHPDGEIGFFNDAAQGIALRYAVLEDYADRLGLATVDNPNESLVHFDDLGYIRIESEQALALIDVAPLGPDHLPGHGHADTLSFELSLFGQRVLVNSGISTYATGSERLRQRGTPAHNTVTIDDANSSEVWSRFRVARRAKPFDLKLQKVAEYATVSCAHDGYTRLPGKPIHRRAWYLSSGELRVADTITGDFQNARTRFHFHPDFELQTSADGFVTAISEGRQLKITVDGATASLKPTTWHPEFGLALPNQCLEMKFQGKRVSTVFQWIQTKAEESQGEKG
jgi:uncharacterized heparinase superfamily protein